MGTATAQYKGMGHLSGRSRTLCIMIPMSEWQTPIYERQPRLGLSRMTLRLPENSLRRH